MRLKRGDKVRVTFEGVVVSGRKGLTTIPENEWPVQISIKPKPGKYSWWAVVPWASVEKIEDNGNS